MPQFLKSVGLLAACSPLLAPAQAADKITYDDHVFPIFESACLNCHNPDKNKGGLDLSNYTGTLAGGSGGAIADPGDGAGSKLYASVTHTAEPFMPPEGAKLSKEDADLIRAWVDGGLLENASSQAKKPSGPKIAKLDVDPSARPEGPPPMPEHLLLEPVVVAPRTTVVNDMDCSPWAPLIAVTGQKQILLYNTDTLRLAAVLPFPKGFPESVAFHPTGQYLLAGGGIPAKSGTTYTWIVPTGELLMENGREFDSVLAASLRLDLGGVALGGPSRLIKLWDTQLGEEIKSIKQHTDWVTALAYSPDGVLLATGDRNGGVWVWEAYSGNEFHTLREHQQGITDLAWRADSNILATASEDGQVVFWEMNNGNQVKKFGAHGGGTLSIAYARNGEFVTSGRDNRVKIWKSDFNLKKELPAFDAMVLEVAITNDGKRVFTADWNGKIEAWDAETFEKIGEISGNPPQLADRIAAVNQQVAEAPKATAEAKTKLDDAQKAVADAQAALQSTVANRDETKTLIATLEQEKPKLDQEIGRLDQEREKLAAVRTERESELTQAEARVAAQQDAIAKAQAEVDSFDVASAGDEEARLAAEAKRLRDESNATPENDALKQQADQAEQALAAHRTKLEALRASLTGAQARLDELTGRLPEIASAVAPFRDAFEMADAELKSLEAERGKVAERRDNIGPETQAANQRLGELESAIKPAEENVAAKQQAVAEPQAAYDQAVAREEQLRNDLKFWQAAVVNTEALAAAQRHKALKAEHDADLAALEELDSQLAQLQQQLASASEDEQKPELVAKIAALEMELADLKPAIDQRAAEVARLDKELAELKARYYEQLK